MPHLIKIPDNIDEIIFSKEALPLPSSSKRLRMLLYLLNIPFLTSYCITLIKNFLELPKSTSLVPGFKCIVGNIFCGEHVGLFDTLFVDYAPIYIGNNVGFSYRNILLTSTHDFGNFQKVIAKPIIIEDNVWITSNVTILPGVRIGENSIIGAGSVVTKDIPKNVFAAGNPCRVIKNIHRL